MRHNIKNKIIELRKLGLTFSEIVEKIGVKIPKSTISLWTKGVLLSEIQNKRISEKARKGLLKARNKAVIINRESRKKYLDEIYKKNLILKKVLENKNTAKVALAVLYLAEGGKKRRGSLVFGNSDPRIVKLFMKLLNEVYSVDPEKIRCTVQCRADQKDSKLEDYWSEITGVSKRLFYETRIDPRTIGRKTVKEGYRGVCRIDVLSAKIFNELMVLGNIITE